MQRPRPPRVAPGPLCLPVAPPADAAVLFDGTDLRQWRNGSGGIATWEIREGALVSRPHSGYIFTAEGFGDVQLHVEWSSPTPPRGRGQQRGNSGIFLMSKYEIQVLDSYENETYADGQAGSVYGQYPPLVNASLPPGEWQTFDVLFRRPRFAAAGQLVSPAEITLWHNGILVQDHVPLWGPTRWLQHFDYEPHADRLPIGLQDHGNPVRYRNIWLRELPDAPLASAAAPAAPATFSVPTERLPSYAGEFAAHDTVEIEVGHSGDELWARFYGGRTLPLVARSTTRFDLANTAGWFEFQFDPSETTSALEFHIGGEVRRLKRIEASPR